MKKYTLFGVFIACISVVLIGCGDSVAKQKRLSKAEKMRADSIDSASFRVGVLPTLDCLPVYVAKERKLFDSLGVDVHLRRYTAQMDCDTALERKRVIGSVSDLVRVNRLQNRGIELVVPISTNTYWQLITNRRSRISDLKQLSDKMIAITRFSATDFLANLAIDSIKPKYDVYRVQINDVNIRLKMLLNNEMDAVLLTEPQATLARLNGHKVLMDSRDKDLRLGCFAFRKKGLSEPNRTKQLDTFIKAYNMAVDSINRYGLAHYGDLIVKYCNSDVRMLAKLPKIQYSKAASPRLRDLEKVKRNMK